MADVFTDAGEGHVVDQIDAFGTYYVAWGTGTDAAAKGDTTLQTEAAETRVATTDSQPSASVFQSVGTITATGSKTITEMGLLTASTSGVLVIRSVFTGIAVTAGDAIQFTIQLTLA